MPTIKNLVQSIQHRIFDSIVSNRLVYNTCWEDPRIDRQLLDIDEDSNVVMLTSAGCNSLDYLLDNPDKINAIDINPAQNALLEIKAALVKIGDYDIMYDMFVRGYSDRFPIFYQRRIRPLLADSTREFWDRNLDYFNRTSAESSFYFRGTSGKIAWMIYKQIRRKGLYSDVLNMLNARTLEEQKYYFKEIESEILNGFYRWLLNRSVTMAMLGVPADQRKLIEKKPDNTLFHFIRTSLSNVFTERPLSDNYFWRVYLTGSYTRNCCPNYLVPEHFVTLRSRIDKIETHTSTLTDFLISYPNRYTHFVLLDHQDWLARSSQKMLAQEWKLILQNSKPGTRILFRSAGHKEDIVPAFIYDYLDFEDAMCEQVHNIDRVGTYSNTYLGIVQKTL